jgi:HK97 family phage prohead protease
MTNKMLRRIGHNAASMLHAKALPILPGSDAGWIEGYAAVWNNVDLSGETMLRGCFAPTLSQDVSAGKVKLMSLHYRDGGDCSECVGTVTEAIEDPYGLWVHADLSAVQHAQDARKKVIEGHVKFLSVGFRLGETQLREPHNDQEVKILDSVGERKIMMHTSSQLCEVTLTVRPANPLAAITGAKSFRSINGVKPSGSAKTRFTQRQREIELLGLGVRF